MKILKKRRGGERREAEREERRGERGGDKNIHKICKFEHCEAMVERVRVESLRVDKSSDVIVLHSGGCDSLLRDESSTVLFSFINKHQRGEKYFVFFNNKIKRRSFNTCI